MKQSFVLYTVQYKAIAELRPEQKGLLFDSLFRYAMDGNEPPIDDEAVRIAFNFMRVQMDMDGKKYEAICEKRRVLALDREKRKREQKATNDHKRPQTTTSVVKKPQATTNSTDNDNVNENVNDNDNVNENEETNVSILEEKKEKKESLADEWEKFFVKCLEFYNNMIGYYGSSMKKVKTITPVRRERLKVIFQTYKKEDYRTAIVNATQSKFCNGKTRERNRPVDFNWLIEFENFTKAFENAL